MVTVGAWPRENSKTFERNLVRVRPPLPAPFKSSTCSTDSVRPRCFRSKIVPEMCLTRFRERDDRARGTCSRTGALRLDAERRTPRDAPVAEDDALHLDADAAQVGESNRVDEEERVLLSRAELAAMRGLRLCRVGELRLGMRNRCHRTGSLEWTVNCCCSFGVLRPRQVGGLSGQEERRPPQLVSANSNSSTRMRGVRRSEECIFLSLTTTQRNHSSAGSSSLPLGPV